MFKKLFSWFSKKDRQTEQPESLKSAQQENLKPVQQDSLKIESFDPNLESEKSFSIQAGMTKLMKAISDADYERFSSTFKNFDPRNPPPNVSYGRALKPVEKAFLKYMIGKPIENPLIAGKWYYEAKMNIGEHLASLVNDGYLTYGPDLKKLKVAELKQFLEKEGLSVVGKKADLIARLQTLSTQRLEELFPNLLVYQATSLGQSVIDEVVKTIAVDPEFEEKVFSLLSLNDYAQAYAMVCKQRNDSMPYQSIGGASSAFTLPKKDPLLPRIPKIKEMASSIEIANLVIYSQWMGIGNRIRSICKNKGLDPEEGLDLLYFAQTGDVRKKPEEILKELLELSTDQKIRVGSPKKYSPERVSSGVELDDIDAKFINNFNCLLSMAGWNVSTFKVKQEAKGSFSFYYKDCLIGRFMNKLGKFSMLLMTEDDIHWMEFNNIDECMTCSRIWLMYAKQIRHSD